MSAVQGAVSAADDALCSGVKQLVRRIVPHADRLVAAYASHLAAASPADVRCLRLQPAGHDPCRACNMTAAALAWLLSGTDAFLPYTFDWRSADGGFGRGVRAVAASSDDGDEFGNAVEHVALFVGADTVFDSFFERRELGERTARRSRAEDYSGGLFVRHVPVRVDLAAAEARFANIFI